LDFTFTENQTIWFCNSVAFCRNEAVVISGRKLAQQIKQEVRQEVEEWVASGNKRPHLSVILVGENPASHSYVLNKTRAAADVGRSPCQTPATMFI
jgi:methylenetetrahydrofolate dehydrogenase(NAD+)/5,10-methenyltetrahydrofolate cyclohydrolase